MSKCRLFVALCLIASAVELPKHACAQAPPGVFADASHPAGPPDPEKLAQVWQVDPISGQVSIDIPFDTTPHGGRGPQVPFRLLYNSGSTITLQGIGSVFLPGTANGYSNTAEFQWGPPQVGVSTASGPWTTSGPYERVYSTSLPDDTIPLTNSVYAYGCQIDGPYIYTDEAGTPHDMNLEQTDSSGSSQQMSPCLDAYQAKGVYGNISATSDGSAIQTNANGNVLYPDGTQYLATLSASGTLEDSNGNKTSISITSGSTLVTDSLSRTAFSTTVPVQSGPPIPPGTYSVTTTGPTGTSQQYSVVFANAAIGSFTMPHPTNSEVTTNSYCYYTGCPTAYSVSVASAGTTFAVLKSIGRPDGTSYTFTYDPVFGTISKITFPTGGYVRFDWTVRASATGTYGSPQFSATSDIVVKDVWTSDGSATENHWTYVIDPYSSSAPPSSTVTNPDSTYTKYTGACFIYSIVPLYRYGSKPSCKVATSAVYSAANALVQSDAQTFCASGLLCQEATTLYGGANPLQRFVQYLRDAYGNVAEKDESDFYTCTGQPCLMPTSPPSNWLRRTYTAYNYQNNTAWVTAHIVNKPSLVLVTDGGGTPAALTTYAYDEHIGTTPVGLSTHDDATYGSGSTAPRGDLTTESRCIAISGTPTIATSTTGSITVSGITCSSSWNTSYYYDLTGQVTKKVDGWSQTPADGTSTTYTWGGQLDGFLQNVQHPYGFIDSYTYYTPTGDVSTHTDWNGQITRKVTTFHYDDTLNMGRITEISYPDSGAVSYSYTDAYQTGVSPSVQVTITTGEASGNVVKTSVYDGLGRLIQTQNSDPYGIDKVDTTYDSMGRVYSISNPYRGTSGSGNLTYSYYDPAGRLQKQLEQDGASTKTWSYPGNITTFTDENKNSWQRTSDGLGRLTLVTEPNGANTTYGYSLLGLTSVTQDGGSAGTTSRNRSFSYDGLSRLTSAANPETGASTYTYPSSVASCGASGPGTPCTKTDHRGVTISYSYDLLNRLQAKSYSDGQTPIACYQYDASSFSCPAGSTNSNLAGRVTNAWTQQTGTTCRAPTTTSTGFISLKSVLCYDPMGRPTSAEQQQCVGTQCSAPSPYSLALAYDLAGNITTLGNSVGAQGAPLTLTTNFDTASRPCLTTGTWASGFSPNLFQTAVASASTPGYSAFGSLGNWYLGSTSPSTSADCSTTPSSAVNLLQQFDTRMRVTSVSSTGQVP